MSISGISAIWMPTCQVQNSNDYRREYYIGIEISKYIVNTGWIHFAKMFSMYLLDGSSEFARP
jgi:hypothetical protein